MKIAIGGFMIESCTFSPLLSQKSDFEVVRGNALLERYPFRKNYSNIECIPLIHARALPGGPVERRFYEEFKGEFLESLKSYGPWDGIFLHMHGAVYVQGMEDAEGDLVASLRSIVGPSCLVAASYDLHGNVSQKVMDRLDILSAYRTAPHVDVSETQERTFGILVKCIAQKIRPFKAFIPVPILLPGEKTSTEWEPGEGLYQSIPDVIQEDAVMDASILIGYVWADEPRSTASVIALGVNQGKVQQASFTLAKRLWEARHEFKFGVAAEPVDRCLQMALNAAERPVIISDSGDNPTAGGAGDIPYVLERMLALGITDGLVAGITDPAAVTICKTAGVGAEIELSLGGKLDPVHGKPLKVKGIVRSLHSLPWVLNPGTDQWVAVVDLQGLWVILTQYRTVFHRLIDFQNLNIDPQRYKILVVKIGYLEPELKALAGKSLLALSPGAVNQEITSLPFSRIQRPMFPFDPDMRWTPKL